MLLRCSPLTFRLFAALIALLCSTVSANSGYGILGVTKMNSDHAECASACRTLVKNSQLTCSATLPGDTSSAQLNRRQSPTITPVECYLKDAAYLRTLALCIVDYCPSDLRLPEREKWWEKGVATASFEPWDPSLTPSMTYDAALQHALEDMAKVGEADIPIHQPGAPLNKTSRIPQSNYTPVYNSAIFFSDVAIAISTICIPLLFSLVRILPGRPLWYSRLEIALQKPVIGRRHRTPMVGNVGLMPTRGQSLYIGYIIISQLFLSIFPILTIYPNASWPSGQLLSLIGDRTGDLAMANFLAVFLFSSRNNILLWMTNWSHSTFLLLHRWISYCLIIEASLHSFLLLIMYWSTRDIRQHDLGWIWGIVGTMALVLLWPASILSVRQRAYEFFLAFHQVFSAVALVGTFFHIYKYYKYYYGFEIWVYIGGAVWFLDRLIRLLRLLSNGICTATITSLDPDGEYIQIDIDGITSHGHVYLSFPTLSWRFWENHPYSVLSTYTGRPEQPDHMKPEPDSDSAEKKEEESASSTTSSASTHTPIQSRTTALLRAMDGLTKTLTTRLLAAPEGADGSKCIILPVLVESSYHSNPATHDLAHCSTLLCIAGGVGITAVLPIMRSFEGVRTRLAWGMRNEYLLHAVDPQLKELKHDPSVQIETRVGERLPLFDLLKEEMENEGEGALGIVVCGPTGMADELASKAKKGTFSW
ncbi:metalloreductase [Ephemerocybe angulata]|uniref:Metalloreductase n=1 Tax=Ephemerocybe angulata TaxID=980116 RepID=A0A8H6IG39_9AGAR|nr:metalloreductase [Tulosesus angulatus]